MSDDDMMDIVERQASKQPRPMTSPTTFRRHHKRGHGTSSLAKPSDEKREREHLTGKQAENRSTAV